MTETLPNFGNVNFILELALLGIGIFLAFVLGYFLPNLLRPIIQLGFSNKVSESYQAIIEPYQRLIGFCCSLLVTEFSLPIIFFSVDNFVYPWIELAIGITLTISLIWLLLGIFQRFFDIYIIDRAIKTGRKTNSELLILGKILANLTIILLALISFAQTHQINILGIFASLGIGGLAVAFAAQKTLEQILGGIVLYLDKPFIVDDYVGLPDGTFGRIESIGLRSTKIRATGKGTLIIVPNNALTQITIENYTSAKKVMALICLDFDKIIINEERALIRQVILESTSNIFGIDSKNTDVVFKNILNESGDSSTQVQITFFILGSGEVSMELRRQLLDIANQNIAQKLREYGAYFQVEEPTIYVDSPITI
jgi:MscS family membrane protein